MAFIAGFHWLAVSFRKQSEMSVMSMRHGYFYMVPGLEMITNRSPFGVIKLSFRPGKHLILNVESQVDTRL